MPVKYTKEYLDYLSSAHWQEVRSEAIHRAGSICEGCGKGRKLQGHHMIYRKPLTAGTAGDVMALCEDCHESWHQWIRKAKYPADMFSRPMIVGALLVLGSKLLKTRKPKESKSKTPNPPRGISKLIHQFQMPPMERDWGAPEIKAALFAAPGVAAMIASDDINTFKRTMKSVSRHHKMRERLLCNAVALYRQHHPQITLQPK